MGREVRKVPKDWEHPKDVNGDYIPLLDSDYETACKEWYEKASEFKPNRWGNWYHEDRGNPPDKNDCYRKRKWSDEESNCYQAYEDVSEGTPITPVFETKEELVEYLVKYGTYWTQKDGEGGVSREAAEEFVKCGFAFSMMATRTDQGFCIITQGIETCKDMKK